MDEQYLVQQAQQGDHQAFTRLVSVRHEELCRYCIRLTGNAAAADELAHETFVEAFLKLTQLKDTGRFAAWLHAIALNIFRMMLRQQVVTMPLTEDMPADQPVGDTGMPARLSRGLAQLSRSQRLVIVLHYLEGLSYEEIAAFLDVPVGTVMSRLHRGRKELKRLTAMISEEESQMIPDEHFMQEVTAETMLLLELYQQDKTAPERLSVLLRHNPEQFIALIHSATDEEHLDRLAMLLQRLGRPALELVMNCALTMGNSLVSEHAHQLLQRYILHLREHTRGGPALNNMPPIEAYYLLDGLFRSTAEQTLKAQLLAELLVVCEDEPTTALLSTATVSHTQQALPALMTIFLHSPRERTEFKVNIPVLTTLVRMGTIFVAELLPLLGNSNDASCQQLGLLGLEGVARSLYSSHGAYVPSVARKAMKWAPIDEMCIDQNILAEAIQHLLPLFEHQQGAIRTMAIRVAGLLRLEAARSALEQLVVHTDSATRVAALRALGNMEYNKSNIVILAALHDPRATVRISALEAAGRLQIMESIPELLQTLSDPDEKVRRTVITVFGDIGGEEARETLQSLLKNQDRVLSRTAAIILTTSPHFRKAIPISEQLHDNGRHVKERLLGECSQPQTFISLYAAIHALPEIRTYQERELTTYIARACIDYATTRRQLIMDNFMQREKGSYTLTEAGKAIWRVERYIADHYMNVC